MYLMRALQVRHGEAVIVIFRLSAAEEWTRSVVQGESYLERSQMTSADCFCGRNHVTAFSCSARGPEVVHLQLAAVSCLLLQPSSQVTEHLFCMQRNR